MSKVILELIHMPQFCLDCTLSTKRSYDDKTEWNCSCFDIRMALDYDALHVERPKFCPLKEVNKI